MLTSRGCQVNVVPATMSADEVLALNPDGVFLSNGPGDPEPCAYAIANIQTLINHRMPKIIYFRCIYPLSFEKLADFVHLINRYHQE